jgi:hypothetical protein
MAGGADPLPPRPAAGEDWRAALSAGALLALFVLLAAWAAWSFRGEGDRLVVVSAAAAGLLFWLAERRRPLSAAPALPPPPSPKAIALAVLAVAAGVSLPSLRGSFLADDLGYLQLFSAKPLSGFLRLGDISEGIWGFALDEMRPLFALSYKIDYLLHGTNEAGYHLTNLLIHALCSVLVASIAAAAGGASWAALLAGVLFAVAPVHAEPISWITGKVDSLPTVFYLASFFFFVRYRARRSAAAYGLSLAAMAAGLLCKEILLTLPAVLFAYDAVLGARGAAGRGGERSVKAWARSLLVYVPFALVAAGYAVLRRVAVGSYGRESALGLRALVRFALEQDGRLRHLLVPFPKVIREAGLDAGTAVLAGLVLGALLAAALLLHAARDRFGRAVALVVFFGPLWYGITVLPLLVTYRAARHLYLPSAGVAVAVAHLLLPATAEGRTPRSGPRLLVAGLLATVWATLLVRQNERWVQAGAWSRESRADLARMAGELPPGGTVVIDNLSGFLPGGDVYFWRWGLPFGLQRPFASRDLYTPLNVLEPPEIYCCPASTWWLGKRPAVAALLDGPGDERVDLALVHWNEHRRRLVLRKGRPARAMLRTYVERALGGPVASVERMDPRKAERLLTALATAVHQSPP